MENNEELVGLYINHILNDLMETKKNQLLLNAHLEYANKTIQNLNKKLEEGASSAPPVDNEYINNLHMLIDERNRIIDDNRKTIDDLISRVNALQNEANTLRSEMEKMSQYVDDLNRKKKKKNKDDTF